jgi:MATE family multidrug resistance protein
MNTSIKEKPLWIDILQLAVPLILSMIGLVIMQFIDALFLSWYSADAVAAVVPAGMAATLVISPFQGTVGFTAIFVAHYVGAKCPQRAFSTVWQGIYLSLISGLIVFIIGFFATPLFSWAGHGEQVKNFEIQYFSILCWFALTTIIGSALAGFFSGLGRTRTLMVVQLLGLAINTLLDYCLIFGKWGFPVFGVSGAAIATVIAQGFVAMMLFILFLFFNGRIGNSWKDRKFEPKLLKRLVRFGFPSGLRFASEMLAWTLFILFIGRIGIDELAATNIAFRLNGFAFFPIIGLGQAVGILVGQAQGSLNPQKSMRLTYVGFYMAELWMITVALLFLLFPNELYSLFRTEGGAGQNQMISSIGVILLRFVAIYSLFDACNIIFVSSLQSAGDTHWTLVFSIIAHAVFLGVLATADFFKLSIWFQWTVATVFVTVAAFTWLLRFHSGKWKNIRVIEPGLNEQYD